MSSIHMHEAIFAVRLQEVGLPLSSNLQLHLTGTAPPTDPYASPAADKAVLSGFGQLMLSSELTDTALAQAENILSGATGQVSISSSNQTVATAAAGSSSTVGSYALNVSQLATAMQQTSQLVIANPNAAMFSAGAFNVTVNGNTTTVQVSGGSLNDLISDINAANAGITATAVQGQYGYQLRLSTNQTGAGNTFSVSVANGGPFDPWVVHLAQLGLTTTQTAQNASYTVNGGPAQTSASNNITLAPGINATLLATGTTTVNVSVTWQGVSQAAQTLAQNYNALRGTFNNLTGSGGALQNNTIAGNYANAAYNDTQASYGSSTYTQLAQLGLTVGGVNAQMQLNNNMLQTAFNNDSTATADVMKQFVQQLRATIAQYAKPDLTSQIVITAQNMEQNLPFILGQPASNYNQLHASLKQYLLEQSLYGDSNPVAMPRISVFT